MAHEETPEIDLHQYVYSTQFLGAIHVSKAIRTFIISASPTALLSQTTSLSRVTDIKQSLHPSKATFP